MTEELRDIEKVSRAATEIENLLGTGQIELELANAADVNSDPTIEIKILGPVSARICHRVSLANFFEPGRIDCFYDPLCLQWEPV